LSALQSLWRCLPVLLRAVLTGSALAGVGTTPWAVLAALNAKHGAVVPWAVLPTALYLWFFWKYVRGAGWPRSTAPARRERCRANRLSDELWGAALLAGGLGLGALVLLLGVANRLVRLPAEQTGDLAKIPAFTLLASVFMGALVAGVVEETSFRGYMQGPIERRHGPLVAILVTGSLFACAHFTHPEVTLRLMPYYMAVAALYGVLAYLTNSILPSIVLHAGGNVLGSMDLLTRGQAEWQASPTPKPLIWETGADASFWLSCVAALVVGAATVWAVAGLAAVARRASGSGALRVGS
jgi:membrane protease YdiL (CAAX protease family)